MQRNATSSQAKTAPTNPTRRPAGIIHKRGKHELGVLMRRRARGDGDHNNEKGYQRRPQRHLRDHRQPLGRAIPDKSKNVDDDISNKDMPRQNDTDQHQHQHQQQSCTLHPSRHTRRSTHKSGWLNCQQPTPALAVPNATLALVKILPAHANQPVK